MNPKPLDVKKSAADKQELDRLLRNNPEHVAVKLSDFVRHYGFTDEELLEELGSGRLVAHTNGPLKKLAGNRPPLPSTPDVPVWVTVEDVRSWIRNPATPEWLVDKMTKRRLQS